MNLWRRRISPITWRLVPSDLCNEKQFIHFDFSVVLLDPKITFLIFSGKQKKMFGKFDDFNVRAKNRWKNKSRSSKYLNYRVSTNPFRGNHFLILFHIVSLIILFSLCNENLNNLLNRLWKLFKAENYPRLESIPEMKLFAEIRQVGTYYASETAEETVKTWLLQPQMKITIHLIWQDRQEILYNGIAYNLKSRIANHWA